MNLLLARSRSELRNLIASLSATLDEAGVRTSVGFVPTMGALHEGHATLIKRSSKENAITVVSIFVNPKQFATSEDLDKYPRTLEADLQYCKNAGAQIVFAPSVEEMYPNDFRTQVSVGELSEVLCGAFRPGHFTGVCTVVLLLLNLVRASKAYFGLKDFQQFSIVSRMLTDLEHPTQIVGVATVRDVDGLAKSSRNRFLDSEARQRALRIPLALRSAAVLFLSGTSETTVLLNAAMQHLLSDSHFELQYCELRESRTLTQAGTQISNETVLAIAAFVTGADGVRTRLIDNVLLTHDPEHLEPLLDFVRLASSSY